MSYPILYSFRRCPYAMRARMALKYANITVIVREIELKSKPKSMIEYSPKGTVPVLVVENDVVIDESLDIMDWSLSKSDRDGWLDNNNLLKSKRLIEYNDNEFKTLLDNYKYPQKSKRQDPLYYRNQAIVYLSSLNESLTEHQWLLSDKLSMADVALFPFIRQFAMVDNTWFMQTSLVNLQEWLNKLINSELFLSVMKKYQPWDGVDNIYL
ncbi:MAG: glutathione S-transferase [Legionellaceae bacterium]|nr:glutathione S-transferase [Legionellaceae bacterium]